MKPERAWPLIITGLLVIHVAAMLIFVWVATSDPSYAVEEDYYQKAVHWDDKRAQDARNRALGWKLTFQVQRPMAVGDRPTLRVRLADGSGAALTGAGIGLVAFRTALSGRQLRVTFAEEDGGVYTASPPMLQDGKWELRFRVELGDDVFTATERRYLVVTP